MCYLCSLFFTFSIWPMNNFSIVQKWGIISLLFLLSVGTTLAALVYDPDTWTYTDDSVTVDVPWDDSNWIPVDEGPTTTAIDTTIDTTTTEPWSSWEDNTTVIWIPVDEEATEEVNTTDPSSEIVEPTVSNEEIIDLGSDSTIVEATDPTTTATTSITIKSLKKELNTTVAVLDEYLDQNASDLAWVYNSQIVAKYGAAFWDLVACLWDDNAVLQIQNDIQSIITSLDTRIKTDSADIFAQISNIQYKKTVWLLDAAGLQIEGWVIMTNIDTFNQNYISLIDNYTQQGTQSINDFITSNEATKYQDLLDTYTTRTQKLNQLKQAFDNFENGAFFGQTVVGPRADELEVLSDEVFRIFENEMRGRRWNRSQAELEILLTSFKRQFADQVDEIVTWLFPYGDIEQVYNTYNLLSSVYGLKNDAYTCAEVISNKTVDTAGPELISKIQKVQENIAVAQSSVGWATSWLELQEWMTDALLQYYQTSLKSQYESAYATAEIVQVSEEELMFTRYKTQVVAFLLEMRTTYVANDNLTVFNQKLTRALWRVNTKLDEWAEGRLLIILQAIKAWIQEVL